MAAGANTSDDPDVIRAPTWALPIAAALLSGLISYFVGQIGLEHRLTAIEDGATSHAREDDRATAVMTKRLDDDDSHFKDVWFAVGQKQNRAP